MKKLLILSILLSALCQNSKCADFVVTNTSVGMSGGTQNPCPGVYNGYVFYDAPGTRWGWKIDTNTSVHTITANNGSTNKMTAINRFGTKSYCVIGNTVTITNSTATEEWRPAVYYQSGATTNSTVTFSGFIPVP